MALTAPPAHRPARPGAGRDAAVAPERLRSGADIRATITARQAAGRDQVVVHARRRGDVDPARVAVVAGRRVGGAVVRNRAKRRLRAIVRQLDLPAGVDLVVTARPGADAVAATSLTGQVQSAVRGAVRRAAP